MSFDASDPVSGLLQGYPSGTILVRDSLAASAHFLLPWITAACIQQGHKVVVVAAAYSPAQHAAALKKLGVSTGATMAQQQQQQSPVAFVSAAAAVRQQQQQQQQQQQGSCLHMLYQQIHAAATNLLEQQQQYQQQQQQQQQQQGLTVLLDSLACVSALSGGDSGSVSALVAAVAALGEALKVPYRLIVLAARDIPCQRHLLLATAAAAHVTADIAPLEGRTAALDGSMTVTCRRAPSHTHHRQQQQQQPQGGGVSGVGGGAVLLPSWLRVGGSSVWFFRCGDVTLKWLSEVHGKELMG